jgi:site-specific DNA-methyltransferase (adenine-specific)
MEIDRIVEGDCLEELPKIDDNSIDAIVTDPPAGISFMGKEWDKDKGGRNAWISWMSQVAAECLRVIKPGGHALVWALPRTSHWTGMAWEEAGWEPRDKISHVFGSGFPKSLDISKKLDQMAGAEREIIGIDENKLARYGPNREDQTWAGWRLHAPAQDAAKITAPATPAAKQWAGWGSAIKPSHEDWWLFRKPLACKTIAENVLEWGCGGLNIDGCRIGTEKVSAHGYPGEQLFGSLVDNKVSGSPDYHVNVGRFPANLIWSHSPLCKRIGTKKVKGNAHYSYKPTNDGVYKLGLGQLDDLGNPLAGADGMETVESWDCHPSCPSWEFAKASESKSKSGGLSGSDPGIWQGKKQTSRGGHDDQGTPARFFKSCQYTEEDIPAFAYVAKASRSEREKGLDGMPEMVRNITEGHGRGAMNTSKGDGTGIRENKPCHNQHPTVKPLELMKYLVRLATPPNGIILDPFAGSGTTLLAAKQEGFRFLGIEKEAEYCDICRKRIAAIPASLDKWL